MEKDFYCTIISCLQKKGEKYGLANFSYGIHIRNFKTLLKSFIRYNTCQKLWRLNKRTSRLKPRCPYNVYQFSEIKHGFKMMLRCHWSELFSLRYWLFYSDKISWYLSDIPNVNYRCFLVAVRTSTQNTIFYIK